jgi:hypothetical protein
MKKNIYSLAIALSLGGTLMLSSCSKHDDCPTASETPEQKTERKIKQVMKSLPVMKLLRGSSNDGGNHTLSFTSTGPNGTFTSGANGTNFTTLAHTLYTEAINTVYVNYNSFGANTSGGTVIAGASSLDMSYTFCFSSAANAIGLNLFNTGNALTSGMSGVIGISGDFENFQNATDSTDFADIFHGLAFYIVYDNPASGSYPVVDWQNDDLNDTTSSGIDKKCFTFVLDFQNGRLFMSKSGTITVTGGNMNFEGEYFQVAGFINEEGDFDLNGNLTISVVSGSGGMGCN